MKVQDLDEKSLRWLWDHRRPVERIEHMRLEREGIAAIRPAQFLDGTGKVAITTFPIFAWGWTHLGDRVGTWFLRTPGVDRHWLWVTRTGRRFVRDLHRTFGVPVILNGSSEPVIARWYASLGFVPAEAIGSRWRKYVLEESIACVGKP